MNEPLGRLAYLYIGKANFDRDVGTAGTFSVGISPSGLDGLLLDNLPPATGRSSES
jgi:hypothetical protein